MNLTWSGNRKPVCSYGSALSVSSLSWALVLLRPQDSREVYRASSIWRVLGRSSSPEEIDLSRRTWAAGISHFPADFSNTFEVRLEKAWRKWGKLLNSSRVRGWCEPPCTQLLCKALDSVSRRRSLENSSLIFFQRGVVLCASSLPWNAQVPRGGNRFSVWKWLLELFSF